MVATVDISRVYLNDDGPSVITCRHCDVQHPMHMSQYLHESIGRKLVQIKCKNCERIFGKFHVPENSSLNLCSSPLKLK